MEARRGLGEESDCIFFQAAGDAEVFDISAWEIGSFLLPIFGWQVEVFGTNEISYSAALVSFVNAGPEAVEFLLELIGLVEQNPGAGN